MSFSYRTDEANKGGARLDDALVKAAFRTKGINALSQVVKTEKGFHVLQITNRRPAVNRTVQDAKRQITNILLREKKDSARDKYISGLRANADVKVFTEHLEALEITKLKKPQAAKPDPKAPPKEAVTPIPPKARPAGVTRPPNALKSPKLPKNAIQKKPEVPSDPEQMIDGRMTK